MSLSSRPGRPPPSPPSRPPAPSRPRPSPSVLVHGTPLLRLVHRLGEDTQAQHRHGAAPSFAEQLAPWLGWAEAITLASVLNAQAQGAVPTTPPPADIDAAAAALAHACQQAASARQMYDALRRAIERDAAQHLGEAAFGLPAREPQRQLHALVAETRNGLRAAVAACSPSLRQLAELDEALAHALSARERQLLATLPRLFRKPQSDARSDHALHLAELDACWQPVAGLLAALDEHLASASRVPA